MTDTDIYSGGCSCGAVRFRFRGEPKHQLACSCRTCQYTSGGGPTYAIVIDGEQFRVTRGNPKVFTTLSDAGNVLTRYFCGDCGTHVYATSDGDPDTRSIKVGCVDEPYRFRPRLHLWTSDAPRWHPRHWFTLRFRKNPPGTSRSDAPEREAVDPLNSDHPI
jgi:hypothetical protein